jgi:hypothetical protein
LKVEEDVEDPLVMLTDVGLTDPSEALSETVMVAPDVLTTGFWNWSMRSTDAVIDSPLPFGLFEDNVQEKEEEPTVPVHVTVTLVPESILAFVKLSPAAEPALMVSTWVPLVSAPETVMVGEPALVSP